VNGDATLRLLTPPALSTSLLAFNTTQPPFDDARVRRAFASALNRERIVDAAVSGFGTPSASPIPPGLPVSPPTATPIRDSAAAAAAFDSAGWTRGRDGVRSRNGQVLDIELLTVGSGDMAIEQLVQADLARVGVRVRIRASEMATFLSTVRAPTKRFDLVVTSVPGDIALGHVRALFHSSQRGGALDYTGYHTPVLDAQLDHALRAPDSERHTAWRAVSDQIVRDAPIAVLYHARGVQGLSARLRGVTMDLRGELVSVTRWQFARAVAP
jgi:peptide/nickel transport system substrate-binding protein